MKFPGRSDRIVSAFAQRLPKGRATSIVGGVAALGKGLPFPADCVLPTMLVARLSVTELSTWPTRAVAINMLLCMIVSKFGKETPQTLDNVFGVRIHPCAFFFSRRRAGQGKEPRRPADRGRLYPKSVWQRCPLRTDSNDSRDPQNKYTHTAIPMPDLPCRSHLMSGIACRRVYLCVSNSPHPKPGSSAV